MQNKAFKKVLSLVTICSMVSTMAFTPIVRAEDTDTEGEKSDLQEKSNEYDYGRAFQLSMMFYDANMCGKVKDGNNKLSWRDDCHAKDEKIPLIPKNDEGVGTNLSQSFIDSNMASLDPDGDKCVDLSGGYHDAGDHVKFGLPQSYSGSTLGWGYYEFRDAYKNIGQQDHIENILKWFNDYFMRCTFRNKEGDVVAFAYQVGDGTTDHCYWGAPEFQTTERPAFFATEETPASDQCAGAAASLAINYLNFKDTDAEYAEKSLDTAKALYKFATKNRGLGFSGGFYNSSYDEDEMSWAAVWLYNCTGDESYINDITSVDANGKYTGYMSRIISTTDSTWQNIWVHSWDTVWGGVFAKLAPITNNPEHWFFFRWNLEYWSGVPHEEGNDGNYMATTPAGYRVVNTWGSNRYNAAAQLCALVYNKSKKNQGFIDWCKSQMNYILGDNPLKMCYEVGYDENSAKHPHHRASHGSDTNSMVQPEESKHVLWGALVGGPDAGDKYNDDRTDFVYNEVAIDYNAGFVGALAGLYDIYGDGKAREDFVDTQADKDVYYVTSKIEQENSERSQVNVKIHNDTSCPPKMKSDMKARYYFDISELKDAGQSIDDLSVQVMYDQSKSLSESGCNVKGPYAYDEEKGIYYVELDWTGANFHGSREVQFALVSSQDSNYKVHWDPTNDWSREGLSKEEEVLTDKISVYLGDNKVCGNEPTKSAEISVSNIEDGQKFDFTEGISEININADVKENDDKVDYVEFYANGEKIGKSEEAPYTISYTPVDEDRTDEYSKDITFEAKAVLDNGEEVSSKKVKANVLFEKPLPDAIKITNPIEGTVLDTTKDEKSLEINVESTGAVEDIESIEVFADGESIGEVVGDSATVTYTPEVSGKVGTKNVEITAKATLSTDKVVECKPVNIKVKYKNLDGLKVSFDSDSEEETNTIAGVLNIVNEGLTDVDLNDVKIRYYFTADSNLKQSFYCDNAGMTFNTAPWYFKANKNISGECVKMENPTKDADTYLEISFNDIKYNLSAGGKICIQMRMSNTNWANFNQVNDYSYKDSEHIVIINNDSVIAGVEP